MLGVLRFYRLLKRFNGDKHMGLINNYAIKAKRLLRSAKSLAQIKAFNAAIKLEDKLPLTNSIVLECESDMDDNPRALYEYLLSIGYNNHHKIIWIVRDPELCKKLHANKNVLFFSRLDHSYRNRIMLNYYLRTSRYMVFSHPWWYQKINENQIILNTGHGIPVKGKPEKSVIANTFDIGSIHSEFTKEWYAEFYDCSKSKLKTTGIPRNDFLYTGNKKVIFSKLIENYIDEKVIICLPTYRQSSHQIDSDIIDKYSLSVVETEAQFCQLNAELCAKKIHLIIKPHPLQKTDLLTINNLSNIHYINNDLLFRENIIFYELLGCTDALITDFSSVHFDYLLIDKPIAYLENDAKNYSRGYLLNDHEKYMAGECIYNYGDLLSFIKDIYEGIDEYHDQRKWLNDKVNDCAKTDNCKHFFDYMIKVGNDKTYDKC